ncbi:MAG TPA: hypothetical protein VFW52_01730 [Candidatus Saccharimonadales bacterium]|nr:hypothetical protein [Candidatus Saccharimonadales bacterium]
MVTTIKVLKRKDAASVVAAVVVGLVLYSLVSGVAEPIANSLDLTSATTAVGEWQVVYFHPVVVTVLALLLLEILLWIYTSLVPDHKR